jgi:hypothetical protein
MNTDKVPSLFEAHFGKFEKSNYLLLLRQLFC